jgi:hypothetical protein
MPTPRESLAQQQAAVVASLTSANPPPPDFDATRIALAAQTLINKRAKSVAATWPTLPQSLRDQFKPLFAAYAQANAIPPEGAIADGRAFARHLLANRQLPEPAHLQLLIHETSNAFPIRLARVGASRRPVLALRIPGVGVRLISLSRTKPPPS